MGFLSAQGKPGGFRNPQGAPPVYVDAGPDQIVANDATVQLAGAIGGDAAAATWTGIRADGVAVSGTFDDASLPNAVFTPSAGDVATGGVVLTLTADSPSRPRADSMAVTILP